MIPVYKWWQLPYFWVGTKCYDMLAGKQNLESSYLLTRNRALEAFPQLNPDTIKGAIVYYDGSHNDARMNVSLAVTAAEMGATVLNHVEVVGIQRTNPERLPASLLVISNPTFLVLANQSLLKQRPLSMLLVPSPILLESSMKPP